MADRYLIGVDVGTTGSKGVLVDARGKVLAYQHREHPVSTPRPGWCEQDADAVWWADLRAILRGLLAQSGVDPQAVAGVGLSALSPDLLPLDEEGRPLRAGILYADIRAAAEIQSITAQLGAERIVRLCGRPLPPDSVGAKLIWLRDHEPQTFARTHVVHTASSYLGFRLTGQHVIDHGSAAGSSPFFDAANLSWYEDVCRELGVSPAIFPTVKLTTDVAGEVTPAAAAETGLAVGTPVIAGTADALAETISTGAVEPGEAGLLYGTTICLFIRVPGPPPGTPPVRIGSTRPPFQLCLPGQWSLGLGMTASGALLRWFRDQFGQAEMDAEEKLGLSAYQLLAQQAETIPPGSEGLVALPYFAGERSPIWDSLARGAILGLTLSHTRRHIYRALLEATAYGLRQGLEEYTHAGVQLDRIIATGGGTRNRAWTQIVSDVIGFDQDVLTQPWGAPYGDAYLAGMGVGLFQGLTELREVWPRDTAAVRWNPQAKAVYDRYYEVYKGLYPKLKDDMHALAGLATAVSP